MENLDTTLDAYDEHFVLDNKLMLEWYPSRVIDVARGDSMLELGLGHGFSTASFAQHFKRYVVVEGSQKMIDRFNNRFGTENIEIVCSYFENFATEEAFDNIMMGFILEHVKDPGLILKRFGEYLKPHGSVFITVPNCESLHRRFGQAAGMLKNLTALSQADHDFGHRRYFSIDTLTKLVTASGFEVAHAEGIFLKPITTGQIEDLGLPDTTLQAMLKVGIDYPELCNAILLEARKSD